MKTTRFIVFSLLMSLALGVNARMYEKNEDVYINVEQATYIMSDWSKDGAKLFLYFFQDKSGGSSEWVAMTPVVSGSKIYRGKMAGVAPWYDKLVVVRKSDTGTAGNWDNVWNQSENISIPDNGDCSCDLLNNFDPAEAEKWKVYSPPVGAISSYASAITADEIHICPNALNHLISLRPKYNADTTGYIYEKVVAHAWYKSTNKTTWTSVDNLAGKTRDGEEVEGKDLFATLPASIPSGGLYYYLYSVDPAGRRLIRILNDAPNCELDCDITSFETAISAVNADDSTYTLDGMVAFAKANGSLVISCDGRDTTIVAPKSPQSFSLRKVPAAMTDGTKTTAKAYFTGDESGCSKTITFDVPNATEGFDIVKKEVLINEQTILAPADADPNNDYVWIVNGVEYTKASGQAQNFTAPAYPKDTAVTYTYKEFFPISGNNDDLMSNGSYEEDDTWNYGTKGGASTVSQYNYWGIYPETENTDIHFYTNNTLNPGLAMKDNGFAVIRKADNFFNTYADVTAKDGNNFALFDAKSGPEGANKEAWSAITAQHPNLKLKKGTTYVLSFWASNVNNYGEMDNAAKFVFRIKYNSQTWYSDTLDLSKPEFHNNLWHQCSQTFFAKEDCDNVTIAVVNLNDRKLTIGNDFGLDDIQFHPISSVSRVVKSHQQFIVTSHEPQVDAFTATTVDMNCNDSKFTVNMNVTYRNAQGKLCIRDIDRDTVYKYSDVIAKPIDVQGTYTKSIVLSDELATIRNWEAYFEAAPANKKTAQSAAPQRQNCEKLDTTICEGQTLTWKGTVYPQTPYIGTDSFKNGFDSLILTINAVPRITVGTIAMTCDSANEVRIPFTVANGNPDIFDIAVNGSHYAGSMDGTDIVFSLTSMEAGDYSAVITSGETGVDCESTAPVSFTIALSGHVYSKWTDVLFISNKEGRFNGYQWFADGAEMAGETMQRLYDPKGLSGTTIQYHCRLTTTEGKTLYTCPQTFDEVTPSRTINTDNTASQVRGIYDTMGRPVNGTPARGIYIVVSEQNGERITTKLIVHE